MNQCRTTDQLAAALREKLPELREEQFVDYYDWDLDCLARELAEHLAKTIPGLED